MVRNSDEFPSLVAQTGPLNGQRWTVQKILLVGREESCDILIPSRQVSRFHARFTPSIEGTLLEDLDSKNGTHRNGENITEPVLLQDGDVVQIALAQQFVYLSSDATLPLEASLSAAAGLAPVETRLKLDKRSRRVWVVDKELDPPLSVAQFQLLDLLYDRQGRVVSRSELIEQVWGEEDAVGVSEQALDALIRRLRDRLAALDPIHTYIMTVRGHGLRLDNPPK